MRSPYEFIIYNHIFLLYEVIRAYLYEEYILFLLGGGTTIFSTLRHLHHEKKYDTIESVFAKTTEVYILLYSYLYLQNYEIIVISKIIMILWWLLGDYIHYELLHPWLHIIAAVDAHIYLNLFIK
jgi:hypothetical protein